jgi:hypothetical protein
MMSATKPIFSGELGVVGPFDLTQLLMLNRATGRLTLVSEGRSGHLFFENGRVINAVDDAMREGESAAYRVFAWKAGRFEFRTESPGGSPSITTSTESLMMEAARLMDEAAPADGGGASETARLRERHDAMEALRDAFASLAQESNVIDIQTGTSGTAPHLALLKAPGDRLVLRPGHSACIRREGAWADLEEPALDPAEYRRLEARLRAGRPTSIEPDRRGAPISFALADGRMIELASLDHGGGEALWMRAIEFPAPDPGLLSGPTDKLDEMLDLQTGLVLAAGPDADATRSLLHMLMATRAEHCDECMLVAMDDRTYRHDDGAGLLLRAPLAGLEDTLESVRPDSVVLDATGARFDVPLAALASVPFVLAGVLAPEPAAILPRWLARTVGGDVHRACAQLAGTPVGLVMVQGLGPDGRIRFNAWILTEAEQSMAMRGMVSELALSLEKQGSYQRRLRLHRA